MRTALLAILLLVLVIIAAILLCGSGYHPPVIGAAERAAGPSSAELAAEPDVEPDADNPPVVVKDYAVDGRTLRVVRDDLLTAGTKQRAAPEYLKEVLEGERAAGRVIKRVVYTAPYNGYGPVAAAYAARANGVDCTLVLSLRPLGADKSSTRREAQRAKTVRKARRLGAQIEFASSWAALVRRGKGLEAEPGTLWLPLGLDDPRFSEILGEKIREAWCALGSCEPSAPPKRMWLVGGSGALASAFHQAFPETQLLVVPAVPEGRPRERIDRAVCAICGMRDAPCSAKSSCLVTVWDKKAKKARAPFPTVEGYDSKAWDAAVEYGEDGDFFWNVAG